MKHPREFFQHPRPIVRFPTREDSTPVMELINACEISKYSALSRNILQQDLLSETSVVAELDGQIVGWMAAYKLPHDLETLFVWQLVVSEDERGVGLGSLMINSALKRDIGEDVERVQTAIKSDDLDTWSFFKRFAHSKNADLNVVSDYTHSLHKSKLDASECIVTVPLPVT